MQHMYVFSLWLLVCVLMHVFVCVLRGGLYICISLSMYLFSLCCYMCVCEIVWISLSMCVLYSCVCVLVGVVCVSVFSLYGYICVEVKDFMSLAGYVFLLYSYVCLWDCMYKCVQVTFCIHNTHRVEKTRVPRENHKQLAL